jgi:hypothetical protein
VLKFCKKATISKNEFFVQAALVIRGFGIRGKENGGTANTGKYTALAKFKPKKWDLRIVISQGRKPRE